MSLAARRHAPLDPRSCGGCGILPWGRAAHAVDADGDPECAACRRLEAAAPGCPCGAPRAPWRGRTGVAVCFACSVLPEHAWPRE